MSSELEIANMALRYVGDKPITQTQYDTPSNERSRLVSEFFDVARRGVLELGSWSVATKSVEIAAEDPGAPAFGFENEFLVPADLLRLVTVQDAGRDAAYMIEGGSIHANLGATISIRYIFDQTNVTVFKPMLVTAIAYSLAADIAEALTQSSTKRNEMIAGMMQWIAEAKVKDANQKQPKEIKAGSWLTARRIRG